MIEVEHLSKRFGDRYAVDDLSFSVAPGEVLGFLGPNGAGKSTTMKMITGFLTPDGGTARIMGHDIQQAPVAAKRTFGYLPEGAPGYSDMTVAQFLRFIADIRGLSGAQREARIDAVVADIHLNDVLGQRLETLSKGFRRRVGLAQAGASVSSRFGETCVTVGEPMSAHRSSSVRRLSRERLRLWLS